MKFTKLFSLSIIVPMIAACEMDIHKAPQAVQGSFSLMFADATQVEWEKEIFLYKAEFESDAHEKEAWFEKDGTWKRTKTEILLSEVPELVLAAANEYKDGAWEIDDIDYYQQSEGVKEFYCVEFDKENSEKERTVRIRPDGTIITDFRE